MPGFDRTGPFCQGPRTGRGIGYCTGGVSRYMNTASVRGWRCFGWFRGWGRRFRFWRIPFFGGASFRDEAEILRQEADILRKNLEAVEKRLSELETGKTE